MKKAPGSPDAFACAFYRGWQLVTAVMLAVAVAVTAAVLVSLVALLLAVDAGFLASDNQLLVDCVELGALLVGQRGAHDLRWSA